MKIYPNWLDSLRLALLFATFFASLASIAVGQGANAPPPRRVALVVGVSDYFHKNMDDLKYAAKDAVDVGGQLKRLGFEVTQVTERDATRQNVKNKIDSFLNLTSKLDSNSIVFLLFSGHGQQLRVAEKNPTSGLTSSAEVPFFCPRDATPFDHSEHVLRGKTAAQVADELNLISLNGLIADIDARSNSLNNLLVIDACRNNPAKGKTPGITGSTGRELPRGISILFAAKSGQKSWESTDANVKQGVMTHYLLQGLRGQARNRRKQITWSRLISYIQEEVEYEGWKLAGGADMKQNPHTLTNSAQTIVIDDNSYRISSGPTGSWPMWGGSPSRNNVSSAKGIPTDWDGMTGRNIRWTAELGTQSYGNPVVAGGKVFVGANNGSGRVQRFPNTQDMGVMLCFDEQTGEFLWQYSAKMLEAGRDNDWPLQGIVSSPLSDGERVWFVDNRARVVCADADGFLDGTNDGVVQNEKSKETDDADVVWRFDMISQLGVFPMMKAVCSPVALGDRLFLVTGNGADYGDPRESIPSPRAPSFICLDRNTGKLLWESNLPGENILSGQWGSPAILKDAQNPQVIFPGGDGWLYSFTPEGKLLWKFDCNPKASIWKIDGTADRNTIFGLPVVHNGLVYVGVGRIPEYAGYEPGRLWCIDSSKRGDVSSELVVDLAGRAVAPRRETHVDTTKGERVMKNPNSAAVWQFTSSPGMKADEDDHRVFHRMLGAVSIQNGVVYACDYAGWFHALDASNGRQIAHHDFLSACWSPPLVVDGKIYVGDEDGYVSIFDQKSIEARRGNWADSEIEPIAKHPVGRFWKTESGAARFSEASIFGGSSISNRTLFVGARNVLFAIQDGAQSDPEDSK